MMLQNLDMIVQLDARAIMQTKYFTVRSLIFVTSPIPNSYQESSRLTDDRLAVIC
jgi:hypothetical protein